MMMIALHAARSMRGVVGGRTLSTSGPAAAAANADPVRAMQLIAAYQSSGHRVARLDPLGLGDADLDASLPPELDVASYFSDSELHLPVCLDGSVHHSGGGFARVRGLSVRELARHLQRTYSGSVGVEFWHLDSKTQRDWVRDKLETPVPPGLGPAERRKALEKLCWAHNLEAFLAKRFSSIKRFGLEGCESLIVGLDTLVIHASQHGVEEIIMGMPHRGRLNVLANVLHKPLEQILCEFRGSGVGTPADMQQLIERSSRAFSQFDTNGDGELDLEELQEALKLVGIEAAPEEVMTLMEDFDEDGTFTLCAEEFQELAVKLLSKNFSGDAKYHLGTTSSRELPSGRINMKLLPNPSHLEAVNPLVMGATRAKQRAIADVTRTKVMPVLLHGDAAFAGQGVVAETLGLSDLHDYTTGGCLHVIVNNQIGFTTDPSSSRSTPYCTDVAKSIRAPIFHVNGDDVEAVARICKLAVEYRQQFGRDVVIDILCYRRNGHQEIDNPMFTQPRMYQAISSHVPVLDQFVQKLIARGDIAADDVAEMQENIYQELERKFEASLSYSPGLSDWAAASHAPVVCETETGISRDLLLSIGKSISTLPSDLKPHRVLAQLYKFRRRMVETGRNIDWALAEQLAWGAMLLDGHHVRVSGQDVQRGTFSHRHAVLHDQERFGVKHVPLAHLGEGAAQFTISNSPLSEFAVLGFELGYSLENPSALVVWEAQFGDFANTAQCIVDQFIAAGESKWELQTGIVLLLPHGLEGGGPEHSSARLERYLQLCDDDERTTPSSVSLRLQLDHCNMQIVNVTTPANYFHVLRRQLKRPYRKPLIVMSPKGLLRHKQVVSHIEEFLHGTRFQPVLEAHSPQNAHKLIFCTGRVSLDLLAELERPESSARDRIAIYKLEQISPFPYEEVEAVLAKHQGASVVWVQEESLNGGAWTYVRPRLETLLQSFDPLARLAYCGRGPSAAPATGLSQVHKQEKETFLALAVR